MARPLAVAPPPASGVGTATAGRTGAGAICTVMRFFVPGFGGVTRFAENSGNGGGDSAGEARSARSSQLAGLTPTDGRGRTGS